jgi:hypothetical protein
MYDEHGEGQKPAIVEDAWCALRKGTEWLVAVELARDLRSDKM